MNYDINCPFCNNETTWSGSREMFDDLWNRHKEQHCDKCPTCGKPITDTHETSYNPNIEDKMDNPYELILKAYVQSAPPDDSDIYEKWQRNLNMALLQSVAYEQGYEQAKNEYTHY